MEDLHHSVVGFVNSLTFDIAAGRVQGRTDSIAHVKLITDLLSYGFKLARKVYILFEMRLQYIYTTTLCNPLTQNAACLVGQYEYKEKCHTSSKT